MAVTRSEADLCTVWGPWARTDLTPTVIVWGGSLSTTTFSEALHQSPLC